MFRWLFPELYHKTRHWEAHPSTLIVIYSIGINNYWTALKHYVCIFLLIKSHICSYIPGPSEETAILSNSLRRNLHTPFPPVQCCYIALLGKAFKKTAISVRMPACIGQQHWSRGHGGSGVIWPHVGGWLFFFEELGIPIVSYPDATMYGIFTKKYCIHTTAPDTETETVFEGV